MSFIRRRKGGDEPADDPASPGAVMVDAADPDPQEASSNGATPEELPAEPEPPAVSERTPARKGAGMVTLHAVGVSDDGKYVLLARRSGGRAAFKMPIDLALVHQLEAARPLREPPAAIEEPEAHHEPKLVRQDSKLTIKEIQHLLRQGKPATVVAKRAGVDVTWVERFESPVIWERAGMARRARRATMSRSRKGASKLPIEEAIRVNLRKRGLPVPKEDSDEGWDSIRRPKKNLWVVRYSFRSRSTTRSAEWEYDPETNRVIALNDLASELGWAGRH